MRFLSEQCSSGRGQLCLLLALLLTPTLSWGFVGSVVEGGHTVFCTGSFLESVAKRKAAVGALMASDFSRIKAHHQKLNQMDDEAFKQYLMNEVGAVAFCHPVASELIGVLPGKNYLDPINKVTSLPSSMDRKITYGIWGYSALYRSLRGYVLKAEAPLSALPEWDQSRYRDELAAAKRLLGRLQGLSPDAVARGEAGVRLNDWMNDEFNRASDVMTGLPRGSAGVLDRADPLSSSAPDENERPGEARHEPSGDQPSWEQGTDKDPLAGALRPTISAYTLQGNDLVIHDLHTVHLMFPSSLGPKNACFERYAPDYPMFARLMATRIAEATETITLSDDETAELLRFFESASSTEGVRGFMISDTAAVIAPEHSEASSLSRCVSLVDNTASQTAHDRIVARHDVGEVDYEQWLDGQVVKFGTQDDLWQSLMALLAAQRIKHAQTRAQEP